MKKVLITNCGPIMTGDIQQPTARGEVIWVEDGTIRYIGDNKPEFEKEADAILDAQGLFVSPSMIDAHCHMPMNDYLPQYKAVDVVENYMGGGISSMISQGPRMPGLPNSVRGAKGAGHRRQGDLGQQPRPPRKGAWRRAASGGGADRG